MVHAPAGEDAFIAMCYALGLIGQVLEGSSKSLHLQNRYRTGETRSPAWVWQYMDQPTNRLKTALTPFEADRLGTRDSCRASVRRYRWRNGLITTPAWLSSLPLSSRTIRGLRGAV